MAGPASAGVARTQADLVRSLGSRSALTHAVGTNANAAPVTGVHPPYVDEYGDNRFFAPDIWRAYIDPYIDQGSALIRIQVIFFDRARLGSGDSLAVFLDTDRNAATGNLGDDYAITVDGATKSIVLARWVGTWTPQSSLQGDLEGGATIVVSWNDLGAPSGLHFWMRASWTHSTTGTTYHGDFAPDFADSILAPRWTYMFPDPPPEPEPDTTPPNTRITSRPAARTTARRAIFRFVATEPDSTFQCKLDRGVWRSCVSPKRYRSLTRGLHTFRVRARDEAGNVDPTPAARTWRVV
ncbi:MAG: hypothetical protein M3O70_10260 [Actinomycetota bacterium]|nr:hypothetical protein [Actinomycetota bacterium]